MFTGLVEEVGILDFVSKSNDKCVIKIRAKKVLENLKIGDSISVNGACLTVTSIYSNYFLADIMPETLKLCEFSKELNLERALKFSDRLNGHIVTGHVDCKGKVKRILKERNAQVFFIEVDKNILEYIVKKGSICINGISLTVVDIKDNIFSVSIIPHTINNTNLKYLKIGSLVNIETDILAKYAKKWVIKNEI